MDFVLSAEHQKIQQVCRKLAEDFATRAGQHDRETSLPVENYEALKREGLYSLTVPKELGGWGAGYLGHTLAAAYRIACETLRERVPRGFAQPMSYHPTVRQRVAEMSVDLEAARLLLYHAAWKFDTEGSIPSAHAAFFRAKAFVGEAVGRITRTALTTCGAHALFKTSALERLFRDGASASIMPPAADFCLDAVGMLELGLDPRQMLPPLKIAG